MFLFNCSRWKLVVHGAIDGYSRCIVYLCCSDNNRSSTVSSLFVTAISQYGLPEAVRSDCGGENVKVGILLFNFACSNY